MTGHFTAFYLSAQEFTSAIELNTKYEFYYPPHITIRVIHHYNEDTFDGILCMNKDYDRSKCLSKYNSSTNGIMTDYNKKEPGAFTFDGIRFFKIVNALTRSDEEALIILTFRYVNAPTFTQRNTAFMIMPFGFEKLNEFYKRNIKDFLKLSDIKIQVYRSDDFTGTDIIADTILKQIQTAEFIICDITNNNKNVFFELGYAKGVNKDIVFLLEQNKPSDFFDVNHIRRIEYSYEREVEFQNILKDTLISIRNARQ